VGVEPCVGGKTLIPSADRAEAVSKFGGAKVK